MEFIVYTIEPDGHQASECHSHTLKEMLSLTC